MKKQFLSIMAAVTIISNVVPIGKTNAVEANSKIRIMPLGDSITDGFWTEGGYRKYLSNNLTEKGYTNIDFVGPNGSDQATFNYHGETVSYDNNHAGYNGYSIQNVSNIFVSLNGIKEALQEGNYMEQYSPDIILLEIGTNDILTFNLIGSEKRLSGLLDYLLDNMENDGVIFLSTVPYANMKPVQNELSNLIIKSYNGLVKKIAKKYSAEGKNVKLVDVNSVVDPSTDLYDELHPNEQGYEKMGNYWTNILDSYLNGNEDPAAVIEDDSESTDFSINSFGSGFISVMSKICKFVRSIFNK